MAVVRRWSLLAVAVAAACAAFWLVRLPTPFLFGGLVGALVYALARPARPLALPGRWFTGGQAVVGAVVGAAVDWRSLVALGPSWVLVVAVSCFSLAVSVLAGQLLVRHRVSRATATFSSIAGGAAGLTALAEELGADARVVAVLQYLRLLVVLVTMPVVVFLVFGGEDSGATTALEAVTGHTLLRDFSYAAAAIGLGLLAGTWLRLPSGRSWVRCWSRRCSRSCLGGPVPRCRRSWWRWATCASGSRSASSSPWPACAPSGRWCPPPC